MTTLTNIAGRVALLLALGACGSDAPKVELRVVHYEQVSSAATGPHLARETIAVQGGRSVIQVDGTITLPDHCDVLRASLELDLPEVELRLDARKTDEPAERCDGSDRQMIIQYVARIDSLPAAQYDFRVVYDSHSAHSRRRGEPNPTIERVLLRRSVTVR